jgi:hypothetical protein
LGSVKEIPRQRSGLLRLNEAKARSDEKSQFDDANLGENAPVVASWRPPGTREKPEEWHPNTNALWWAPEEMNLPVFGTRNPSLDNSSPDHLPWPDRPSAADVSIAIKRKKKAIASRSSWENLGPLPLVPIEWLLWPLEPENLCLKVTGREFSPELLKSHDVPLNAQSRSPKGSPRDPPNQDYQNAAESRVASEMERFDRHKQLVRISRARFQYYTRFQSFRSLTPHAKSSCLHFVTGRVCGGSVRVVGGHVPWPFAASHHTLGAVFPLRYPPQFSQQRQATVLLQSCLPWARTGSCSPKHSSVHRQQCSSI